jgi:pyruvate-formate lyase-activating enzyme
MNKLGPSMTEKQFTQFQVDTGQHLSFSLTLACPLRCTHCMVATISPREADRATLPLDAAETFAAEMPALAAIGIRRISFTGGEPLLARDQLRILSDSAHAAGIETTLVTACHWAKSVAAAVRTINRFRGITHWHISTDVYHTAFLKPEHVVNACIALADANKQVLIRMAVGRVPSQDELDLKSWLEDRVPSDTGFALQPTSPVGRAKEIGITPQMSANDDPPSTPCLTTGPLIRHDGQLSVCCSGLAELPEISPFAPIDATQIGLVATVMAWRNDPLLQLIRAVGFRFPAIWAADEIGEAPVSPAPSHPCDYCTALWKNAPARNAILKHLNGTAIRRKITELYDDVISPEGMHAL